LKPIFCIGETLEEREAGRTFAVIERQIKEGLNNFNTDDIKTVVIAYEPVWAIGTGRTATPEQAQEVHAYIRTVMGKIYGDDLAVLLHVIYGGSVNPGTIGGLMAQTDIDGALVGGASLDVESFIKIIQF
jgi:triosephosphate isomerase